MRRKAVSDKKEEELAVSTMSSIEAKARKEYEEDMRKAGEAQRDHIGTWVWKATLHCVLAVSLHIEISNHGASVYLLCTYT